MALAQALAGWDQPTTSTNGRYVDDDISTAFQYARIFLQPGDLSTPRKRASRDVGASFQLLKESGYYPELQRDFMDMMEERFFLIREDISSYFKALEGEDSVDDPHHQAIMAELLERVLLWQRAWAYPLKAFEDRGILSAYATMFQHLLYAAFPRSFPQHFHDFLARSLASFAHELEETDQQYGGMEFALAEGSRPSKKVSAPSPYLHRMTVLPRYATTLLRVAYDEIERIAKEEASAGWEERRLGHARQRLSETVVTWMSGVFEHHDNPQTMLRSMYSRFDYYLCRAFFDIRTDELFSIIVEYPDTLPALEDLRECLIKVDQRSVLVDKLRAANLKRLLHPGAETKDVITQYISTIRCLRILDPVGVLLHKVAEPIRMHLRQRSDTIRCIVAALVEGEDLQDENEAAQPLAITNDSTVERTWDVKWEPEPVDAAPEFRTGKTADIVGTLVSIYETKEVIVNELQAYLATRLLAIDDYDSVKELRTIELLKIRFGEEALHVCDVMLKDMADSKRIDDHVHGDINSVVHPLIVSRMFWPTIPASSFHLTPKLEMAQADYESAFHHFKPDKHLRWLQEMGMVTINLELEDRTVRVEVTPLQAAIVELFESQDRWTEEALKEKLGVDELAIRGGLGAWAGHGVLKEDGAEWRLLEVVEDGADRSFVADSKAPTFESVDEKRAQRGSLFWTYIKEMIRNLGPQNIETMQRMLLRIQDYDMSQDELSSFMAMARREGQVRQGVDGTWALM